MKNLNKTVASLVLGFVICAPAVQAATYVDYDEIGVDLAPSIVFANGEFDIASGDGNVEDAPGFLIGKLAGEVLQSATISFQIQDSDGKALQFAIAFGNVVLNELNSTISKAINISDVSGMVSGTGLATLNSSGVLTYTLQNTGLSAFTLLNGTLVVETGDGSPGTPVPDAGYSITLLCLGLLGLMVYHRRRLSVA